MGEETPAPPKTAKQLEKEAKKAAEKAAKLEKLAGLILLLTDNQPDCWPTNISAKQAKLSAAKAVGEEDKKEKKPKKDPGAVKEAAVYDGEIYLAWIELANLILRHLVGITNPGEKKDTSKALPDAYSPKYVEVRFYLFIFWRKTQPDRTDDRQGCKL